LECGRITFGDIFHSVDGGWWSVDGEEGGASQMKNAKRKM
jgi:hypothetical protein